MATAYLKNGKLYVGYMDATTGKQKCERAPIELGVDKELGLKLAKKIEEKLQAQAEIVGKNAGPLTVRGWHGAWSARREKAGIDADAAAAVRNHVLDPNPEFANMPLDAVRRRHSKPILAQLKSKIGQGPDDLAPRTVRNIWGALVTMGEEAVDDEVIPSNPFKLKRGSLPKKVDKDPAWRDTAIYLRAEIEQLCVDERVPWDRRMAYATMFFIGGSRFGEAAAQRWRNYEHEMQPLGRMRVLSSYSTKKKKEKSVKTEVTRNVPVHPVYARLLAEWKLSGWQIYMGRQPGPDDLILPSRRGVHRSANHMLRCLHQDLKRIGMRTRRQHDLRRTFISLCRDDGADKELLKWITHGVRQDVMDGYTTPAWETLCRQVSVLKLDLRRGEVIALPPAPHAGGGGKDHGADEVLDGKNTPVTTPLPTQASKGFEGSLAPIVAARYPAPIATLRIDDHREAAKGSLVERFQVPSAPPTNPRISSQLPGPEFSGLFVRWVQEIESRIARGQVGIEDDDDVPAFKPAFDAFLEGLTNRNAADDRSRGRRHLLPKFTRMKLADVGLASVMEWIDEQRATAALSEASIRNNMNLLSRFFSWAIARDKASINPVRQIPMGSRPTQTVKSDTPWLDDDAIVRKLIGDLEDPINFMFYLCNRSGLRTGEAAGLRMSDMAFVDEGLIRVRFSYEGPHKEDKKGTGKVKWVPAPEDCAELLGPWIEQRKAQGAGPEAHAALDHGLRSSQFRLRGQTFATV